MPALNSVDDLCQRYGVTEATVLGWIHSGELKAVNVGRRLGSKRPRWRITDAAVEAFEQLRSAATTTGTTPRKQRRKPAGEVIQFYAAK